MAKSATTELVPVNAETYPVIAAGSAIAETIRHNLGGESVGPSDLSRIRVPSGGGLVWEVPTIDGTEPAKNLDGIVVHIGRRRAYWSNPTPTGDPPECSSQDCVTGTGNPGGRCEACPLNAFGTARGQNGQGRGKACKESKLLFLLREKQLLPDIVVVPSGSLKAVKAWQLKLGVPYWSVVTRLAIEKATNKDGIGYARITIERKAVLDPETAKQIQAYASTLGSVFAAATVDRGDLGEDAEPKEV